MSDRFHREDRVSARPPTTDSATRPNGGEFTALRDLLELLIARVVESGRLLEVRDAELRRVHDLLIGRLFKPEDDTQEVWHHFKHGPGKVYVEEVHSYVRLIAAEKPYNPRNDLCPHCEYPRWLHQSDQGCQGLHNPELDIN